MLIGKAAPNNKAESTLGGAICLIQLFGHIHVSSASAVSSIKRSRYFERDDVIKLLGMFHQLDVNMQQAIIRVAMKDAMITHQSKNSDLGHQAETRQQKEELLRDKEIMKAISENA